MTAGRATACWKTWERELQNYVIDGGEIDEIAGDRKVKAIRNCRIGSVSDSATIICHGQLIIAPDCPLKVVRRRSVQAYKLEV